MNDVASFIANANQCISRQNGTALAQLLALPVGSVAIGPEMRTLASRISNHSSMMTQCESRIPVGLGSVVGSRLSVLVSMVSADWSEANRHAIVMYNNMLNVFREEETSWLIPVVTMISNDIRILGMESDKRMNNRDDEFLREALRNLSNGFNVVAKVRGSFSEPDSKKLALFAVTNVLFKIYFKLNTLQLCSKLINVVERPGPSCATDQFQYFPVSDVVAYKYYVGRLKMFEDRYEEARDCFLFALRYTPKNQIRNIRRILVNLVPVQMCLGVLPGGSVAGQYGLDEFYALGVATRQGNVRLFEEILKTNQRRFILLGVYLVLEQVKVIAYRNLFKKIYLLTNNTRLKLSILESALAWLGERLEMDEIECILANLIYQNKIKGYLSHEKQTLILSKAGPFPFSAIVKRQL